MRKALLQKRVKGTASSSFYSMPAPTKGWNARDSVADMDESFAIVTKNVFPETTDLRVRKGFSNHVTGITGQVESLMPYNKPDGTQTLFCAAGTAFYNVTSAGAVGAAVVSSLTNARWQSINLTNSSGTSYLCCFNGTDSPRYWDGSSWITITGVSTPAITGLTTSTIISACIHKRRMWLVPVNSLKVWYLPVDSVGGAAAALDLAGLANKGGYVMAAETWTIDGGAGLDDYIAFITSEGQVIVYQGTDPSSATAWSMIGVWNIGEPIDRRCMMKFRGDLLVLCVDGIYPLSAALATSQTDPRVAITDNIVKDMTKAAADYKATFGWCMLFYPQANMLILNVPVAVGSQQQYVMNTISRAWGGPFDGIDANCWCIFNQEPYFGGNGVVCKFWDTFADNSTGIDFDMKQAFSYFGSKRLKQFRSMRPNISATVAPSVIVGINVDYTDQALSGTATFAASAYATWDASLWDTGIFGDSLLAAFYDWQTVYGIGIAAAPRIKGQVNGIELRMAATDFIYENGGII